VNNFELNRFLKSRKNKGSPDYWFLLRWNENKVKEIRSKTRCSRVVYSPSFAFGTEVGKFFEWTMSTIKRNDCDFSFAFIKSPRDFLLPRKRCYFLTWCLAIFSNGKILGSKEINYFVAKLVARGKLGKLWKFSL
jgi:hypothetical protein